LARYALEVDVSKSREEKAAVIEQLRDKANRANIALVTDFRGLKVEHIENLRNDLRNTQVDYQIVKNTLARIALQGSPHEILGDELRDCCAIAFGFDDPVVAAKVLVDFDKKNKNFQIRFGSHAGQYLDAEQIADLSRLPSREELLSQLLRTMNAPATNFVGLFGNMLRSLLTALNNIKDQKE
jgi:large subunit ribosomal protein L10